MKLFVLSKRFDGHMAIPTRAQIYPPRLMLMNRGSKAVISVPAETEFAAIFVPSWARAKDDAIKKTPTRVPVPPSSKKNLRRSRGFQISWP